MNYALNTTYSSNSNTKIHLSDVRLVQIKWVAFVGLGVMFIAVLVNGVLASFFRILQAYFLSIINIIFVVKPNKTHYYFKSFIYHRFN